jgi:hypothetical protein
MSTGYYRICLKCGRKYGRHFSKCIDCSSRATPNDKGVYDNAYRDKYGIWKWGGRFQTHFCNSKQIPLDKHLEMCDKCKAKFKCYTQNDDTK